MQKYISLMIYVTTTQSPPETSAQDAQKKKAEPKSPHFLSLNQGMVAWSQEEKCGLKYVISSFQTKRQSRI
jgi:hypothetical protein